MEPILTCENTLRVRLDGEEAVVPFRPGETILEALRGLTGAGIHAPCGGRGTCGKCTVFLRDEAGERAVLACRTPARSGMCLRLPERSEDRVLTEGESAPVCPEEGLTGYGFACDIGTTTVACQLVDLSDGQVLAGAGEGNAQRPFGGDVISRISAWSEGHSGELTGAIRDQLGRMMDALCREKGVSPDRVRRVSVAANPTMCHLLAGLSPEGLGRAPFTPLSLFGTEDPARALGLPFDAPVYLLPAVSAYIGGDITAGMLAAGLDRGEENVLLLDVGTNGELVLSRGGELFCCSCAAGPAFEGAEITFGMTAAPGAVSAVTLEGERAVCSVLGGGEAVGICGSGLLDAVAVMLELGALEPSGRIPDPEEDDDIPAAALPYLTEYGGESAFRLTEKVFVTQRDVRKVQLGKAAVAAGVQVLLEQAGLEAGQVARLLLAGGFGSFLRPESAARVGLIPAELLPVTRGAGNTALAGARMALVSGEARNRLGGMADSARYFELSGLPAFNAAYVDEMAFPGEEE